MNVAVPGDLSIFPKDLLTQEIEVSIVAGVIIIIIIIIFMIIILITIKKKILPLSKQISFFPSQILSTVLGPSYKI